MFSFNGDGNSGRLVSSPHPKISVGIPSQIESGEFILRTPSNVIRLKRLFHSSSFLATVQEWAFLLLSECLGGTRKGTKIWRFKAQTKLLLILMPTMITYTPPSTLYLGQKAPHDHGNLLKTLSM